MESITKNRKTRAQIEAMVDRAFDGARLATGTSAVFEFNEGWFNASYALHLGDGREVVLKIAPPPGADVMVYEKNLMATEVAAMRLVRQNPAIPVPEILYYDNARDLCDADYFFMEKVPGDNLEHVRAGMSPEEQAAVDFQIGQIVREINSFPGAYFGYDGNPELRAESWREAFIKIIESLLEDAARKDVMFDFSYDDLRAAVLLHAPALEEITRPCLVHWDTWYPNFFVKDGKISGIIDFERALWADPLMEAQFRSLMDSSASLRGYGKTAFTLSEEQRKQLYSLHLALVMYIECAYRHYDTDSVFTLSRQYIASTIAWLNEPTNQPRKKIGE